jgi:hypothetical protein
VSDTVCGLFAAVSINDRVSELPPLTVGWKLTAAVHDVPGVSCLPAVQVFDEIEN